MELVGRDFFLHAFRSFDLFRKAIRTFDDYLQNRLPPDSKEYNYACNYLREGQGLFDVTLKKAKKLLGPIPGYSAQDVEMQRAQLLVENKIVVRGLSQHQLREELAKDEFLKTMISPEEMLVYLKDHFISQSSGKRKLANIKVRMILDKLRTLSVKGQELQIASQEYFQSE